MPRWIDADRLPVRDVWIHDDSCDGRPERAVLIEDIEAAVQPSGWIRVTPETMPTEDEIVLTVCRGQTGNVVLDDAVELAQWYCDEGWILLSYPELRAAVLYWMPIPEPPMPEVPR